MKFKYKFAIALAICLVVAIAIQCTTVKAEKFVEEALVFTSGITTV